MMYISRKFVVYMLKLGVLTFIFILLGALHGGAQDYKKIITDSNDPVEIADAYYELMRSFGPQRIDSVMFYAEEAIAYFQEIQDVAGECRINLNMANVMLFNGGLAEGERYCKEVIRLAEEADLPNYLARGYDFMTVIYGKKGEYVKSTEYAYKALRANEALDDKRGIVSSYIKLSAITQLLENLEESLAFVQTADSLNQATIQDPHLKIGVITNKGIIYQKMDQLDLALDMFRQVHSLVSSNPELDQNYIPSSLLNIGNVYAAKRDHEQAIAYFSKSLTEAERLNVPGLQLQSKHGMASSYQDMQRFEESNQYALAALEKSQALNFADVEIDLLELIAENYKQLSDWHNALEYTTAYYNQLAELQQERNQSQVKELQSAYRLEKTEEELRIANALSQSRARQRDISYGFSIVVLCFLLGLGFVYLRIRQLNKLIAATNAKLQESNQVKDKLFSIIGHDLRTAFDGTLSFLKLLKSNQVQSDQMPIMLKQVVSQSRGAMETLNNLLMWGYTQIKAGQSLNVSHFVPAAAVAKSIVVLEDRMQSKSITVHNQIPYKLEVHADENHFRFVTRNLISNAVKFTPNGGTLHIGYRGDVPGVHEFSVQDNGVGIPAHRLEEIFTSQVQSTIGTEQEQGSGLGLQLCKEFIELNGGQIWVESKEGEGTVFYFTLPKN